MDVFYKKIKANVTPEVLAPTDAEDAFWKVQINNKLRVAIL